MTKTSSTVYTYTYTVPTDDGTGTVTVGTGTDAAGNVVTSTPTSGATFTVDNTAPTVSSSPGVFSSDANGKYKAGCDITIKVTFSENVVVDGNPRIELETGTPDRFANYTSGSSSNTLLFVYTVVNGDFFSDLDYKSTGSLSLNSGTIRDAAANDATLTLPAPGASGSLGNNQAFVYNSKASSCGAS